MPEPPVPLPEDQVQVLELLIEGWTDERIARELGITFTAVRRRIRRAADALGARNRVQLAILALERGLVVKRANRTDPPASEGTTPVPGEEDLSEPDPDVAADSGRGSRERPDETGPSPAT